MNKKAGAGENLNFNIIYVMVCIIFLVGILVFINQYSNHASVWEDFYAKEISKVVNLASPGDSVTMDLHKGIAIALKNKVSKDQIFYFNNLKKEVCVKLSLTQGSTCYGYFNNA